MVCTYIDIKYINLCASTLDKFKQKTSSLWNFRCPICGDSQKNKNKCRGFIYEKSNKYFYRCHNCEFGTSFSKFLEKINPFLHKEYITEQYKEKTYVKPTDDLSKFNFVPKFNDVLHGLQSIASLKEDHPAKTYLSKRLIPDKCFSKLYFCTEFKKWTNGIIPNKFSTLKGDTPRLVIPFFDSKNNIIGFQGRSFDPKDLCKYITIKLEGVEDLVYGQERINNNKKKYALILLVPFFRNIVNSTMETGSLCIIIPVSRPLCACVSKCSPDNGIPSIKACILKLTNTEIGIELFL